jgi:hypothetical protein
MTAIGVSFPAAIDMNSSVIQGCFPNGFRAPVPPRPAPMPQPVAQRATMPRGAVFPPLRPVVPQRQQNQPVIQRFGAGTAMRLPDAMQTAASRSIGHPLQPAVRQMMESLFRTSFADVRVHVGPHVTAIGATSYTQGSNIHFAPGQYGPEHGAGRQRLAYELAHVVQQKAGRVRNPFGSGLAIVQDPRLEAEARQFAQRAAMAPVAQPLKSHATAFAEEHELGLGQVTRESVSGYVGNEGNGIKFRRGLLKAWNWKQAGVNRIPLPESLRPKQSMEFESTFDFSAHDSDADDEMDIESTITKLRLRQITVHRKARKVQMAVLKVDQAIRVLRQAVKRNEISKTLPLGVQIGEHTLELTSPYGNDVYAVPLKTKATGELAWASQMADFSWEKLADNLAEIAPDEIDGIRIRYRILESFQGKNPQDLTSEEAEAIAAIACDFMKGSGGGSYYVAKALKAAKKSTFREMFSGTKPHYRPAASGGRAKVAWRTAKLKEK